MIPHQRSTVRTGRRTQAKDAASSTPRPRAISRSGASTCWRCSHCGSVPSSGSIPAMLIAHPMRLQSRKITTTGCRS